MGSTSALILAILASAPLPSEAGGFVRGHVFVAVAEVERCDFGGREWIIEIDPLTGDWSVFADSDDGLCVVSGLRFTPDGTRLLAANAGHLSPVNDGGWIQAFNPDGSSEIILDASDGLNRPYGSNCLAFDEGGDLYVVSAEDSRILRFPDGTAPGTIFADSSDGIDGRGALDFSPNADLFYATNLGGVTLRISPTGQASVFTKPGGFTSIAFDDRENLFAAGGGTAFRFDGPGPDPSSLRVLADGFNNCCAQVAIALSRDRRLLYFAEVPGRVHAIEGETGASGLVADFTELSSIAVLPYGMTVFVPMIAGDIERDGDLDLGDFAAWQICWTGDEALVSDATCNRANLNGDGHVNSIDFANLMLTGP